MGVLLYQRKGNTESEVNKMTKEEMKKRYEQLNKLSFALQMKDLWNNEDRKLDRSYKTEMEELEKKMRGDEA